MTAFIGDPALRQLQRMKLRGTLRRTGRRLRTPAGALFALIGMGFLVLWIGSLSIAFHRRDQVSISPEQILPLARAALGALFLMTVLGTVAHRGLYLPAQEIERLFAAPLGRSDLIRYRLSALLARSLIGGLIIAFVASMRLRLGWTAGVGALLATLTMAIAGQTVALLLGSIERRLPIGAIRLVARLLTIALAMGVVGLFLSIDALPRDLQALLKTVVESPVMRALTLPFEPWAQLIAAGELSSAWPWLLLCTAALGLLFELTARIPVDFREMALATSADVAQRLRRLQRGAGAASDKVSSSGGLRPVPWLFGRSPLGAIAWHKTASMLRRARATLGFTVFLMSVLLIVGVTISRDRNPEADLVAVVMIVLLGTLYLCSGLRFDFREELDRMDVIKAWPLSATRLFGAVLAPQAVLVVFFVGVVVVLHAILTDGPRLITLGILAFVPPFTVLWLALDNAIFLLWPVRFVAGQEGALQNMGRAAVVMLLRLVVVGVLVGLGSGFGFGAAYLVDLYFDGSVKQTTVAGGVVGWVWLAFCAASMLRVGGWILARFEPGSLER